MASESTKSLSLKQRAAREMEEFLAVTLFLSVLLGAITAYRRLLMSEVGVPYLHYGYALIEALVLAKIIRIGEAFRFGERHEDKPLIVSALYKSLIIGFFALVAHVLEHVIHALVKVESPAAAVARQRGEIAIYTLVVLVVFVPFFSLQQAGRLLGEERFLYVLLRRPPARKK
jgi:hypothetical protein